MRMAEKYGIYDYPCPAGGCRLTDPNFAARLKDAFEHNEDSIRDVKLLKYGRHFRLPGGAKVIAGREERENMILKNIVEGGAIMETINAPGPLTLLKGGGENDIKVASSICARYSDCQGMALVRVRKGRKEKILRVKPADDNFIKKFMVGRR